MVWGIFTTNRAIVSYDVCISHNDTGTVYIYKENMMLALSSAHTLLFPIWDCAPLSSGRGRGGSRPIFQQPRP